MDNAKRIFFNFSLEEFTSYDGSEFSHVDYPILVQTLSASLATLIGHWNEIFPKFSNIIMALPAMLIFSIIIKNNLTKLFLFILILKNLHILILQTFEVLLRSRIITY